jgi:hypothetical protein
MSDEDEPTGEHVPVSTDPEDDSFWNRLKGRLLDVDDDDEFDGCDLREFPNRQTPDDEIDLEVLFAGVEDDPERRGILAERWRELFSGS